MTIAFASAKASFRFVNVFSVFNVFQRLFISARRRAVAVGDSATHCQLVCLKPLPMMSLELEIKTNASLSTVRT